MIENLTVKIISVSDTESKEWNEFLQATSESTFFCTTDWWNAYEDSYILQIRDNKQKIIAGIPFRILSVVPIIGRFLKFCILDSSALVNKAYNASEAFLLKKMALTSLIKHLYTIQVIVLSISSKARSTDAGLFKDLNFNVEKSATLLLDLTKDENEIFKLFSKGNKSSIRKAQQLGVQVKIYEGESSFNYIADFCKLQDKLFTYKRGSYSNIYYKSGNYLKKVLSSVYNKSYLVIAYHYDQPAAGAVLISFNNVIYYYLGASDHFLTKTTQASNLLHYEIIKYAKAKGFIKYDVGGIPYSANPSDSIYGVYIFKKSFGGDRFEYDHGDYVLNKLRYRIIWKLRKYENNSLIRYVYNLLNKKSKVKMV